MTSLQLSGNKTMTIIQHTVHYQRVVIQDLGMCSMAKLLRHCSIISSNGAHPTSVIFIIGAL